MSTTTTADNGTYAVLPLDAIVSSRTNPRQHFDDAKLVELSLSIQASGVHQPILVRPLPADRLQETFADRRKGAPLPTHELVAGERRWRASKLAQGVTTIPAMVRNLTDAQVLEIQLVENLQRDDLTELEEADGYQRLIEATSITAEQIGGKIGKSRAYVYGRLKLLELCPEARTALRAGEIDASRGLLIARIPDSKLQIKALAEAKRTGYDGTPISYRSFQTWLQQNVMLRLERAPFQITDARLVPAAGSCKECPKRTGAEPDLFSDVESADICTDPPCFESKTQAHREKLVAKAQAKGMTVIEGKEAKGICRMHSSHIDGYSALDERRDDVDPKERPTLRSLLGKDAPNPVLIENPYTRQLIEAVPTEEAEALLVMRGAIKAATSSGNKVARIDAEIEDIKETLDRTAAKQGRTAMHQALADKVRALPDAQCAKLITADLLRAWLIEQVYYLDAAAIAEWMGLELDEDDEDRDGTVRLAVQAAPHAQIYRAACLLMVDEDKNISWNADLKAEPPLFKAVASHLGVDLHAIATEARTAVKAEVSAKVRELTAQRKEALKPPTPIAPAAPAGKSEKAKPAAAGKKPKLSAEQASSGIAEAMQGLESQPADDGLATGGALNKRVRVKAGCSKDWSGKEGTAREFKDQMYAVTFTAKKGVATIQAFAPGELEVVE